jgi:type IV pilus assembly protein PilM
MAAKNSYVGIDIGHMNIRVAQAEKTAAGVRVAKFAEVATPEDTIRDGLIRDPEEIGHAIKQAMKDAHIHAHNAVIAASGGAVFVRSVPFPKMNVQMLRDSIRFEASRYVPGSIEDSYVEGEVVGNISETQMNVLLAAAPRDIVDGRIASCNSAGLDVKVVEIETFAAYRSLIETDEARDANEKTIILVDIGSSTTTVSVIESGIYVMHRSMPTAGNTWTDGLRSAFKLEVVDAEAGKRALDLTEILGNSGKENPPLKVIATQIDDLVRELRRSMNYLQTQNQSPEATGSNQIDAMYLCGGGAKLKGLDKYIESKLGIPVTTVGVFENPIITQNGSIDGPGIDMAVVTGLAMRSLLNAA